MHFRIGLLGVLLGLLHDSFSFPHINSTDRSAGLSALFKNIYVETNGIAKPTPDFLEYFLGVSSSLEISSPLVCNLGVSKGFVDEWWLANTNATVLSFSSGASPASVSAANSLQKAYPGRTLLMIGLPEQGAHLAKLTICVMTCYRASDVFRCFGLVQGWQLTSSTFRAENATFSFLTF